MGKDVQAGDLNDLFASAFRRIRIVSSNHPEAERFIGIEIEDAWPFEDKGISYLRIITSSGGVSLTGHYSYTWEIQDR